MSTPQSSGAVQPPHSDAPVSMEPSANPDSQDAIREGKQRAKETMAAAGINTSGASAPSSQPAFANGSTPTNGTPQLSRKRSHDGTQLPLNQPSNASSDDPTSPQPSHDEVLLDRYVQRDLVNVVAMNDQIERSKSMIKAKEMERDFYMQEVNARRRVDPGSIFGYGYRGYGNGTTNAKSQIVYSSTRGPFKGRKSQPLHVSRTDNAQQAEQHEELVPIRLDIELDKLRLRDTFTWNLHEKLVSQDQFTDYLLEDLKVPAEAVPEIGRQVKLEMQDQIQNFYPHIIVEDPPLEPGKPYYDYKDDEMRISIRLNITIGRITLVDQFEWDINNPLNSPEEFARQMAWENALSGEFTTAIAHSIREQSQLYTKSLYLTNHCFDGRPVEDPELKDNFLATPLHSAFRPMQFQKDWTPYMYEMSEAELERTETSMMREHRAQKRQLNRRGGPALPDLKDRQRTVRSLIVHTVIPGAVESFETTGIPKTRRAGRGGRRNVRNDGDLDSDDLESDESGVDSPAPSSIVTGGTARTRGMRGAASAATAAMRANYGRSVTPDSLSVQPPEATSSRARRSMLREESVAADDSESMIIRLKIPKIKFKAWLDEYRAKKRASEYPLSGYASQPPPVTNPNVPVAATTGGGGTPARAGNPATPSATPRAQPQSRSTPQPNGASTSRASSARPRSDVQYDSQGRVDTDHWPNTDEAPPAPPPWLQTAIATLRAKHPDDDFAPLMRPYCLNADTGDVIKASISPGDAPGPGQKFQFQPRIRCNDCPGKLYTAQPEKVVEDFEVHLRNRSHREKVQERLRKRP